MATNTLPQAEETEALKKSLRMIDTFILASGWAQDYFKDLHVKNNIDRLHPDNIEFHAFFAMMLRIERLFGPAMNACDEIKKTLDFGFLGNKTSFGVVKFILIAGHSLFLGLSLLFFFLFIS